MQADEAAGRLKVAFPHRRLALQEAAFTGAAFWLPRMSGIIRDAWVLVSFYGRIRSEKAFSSINCEGPFFSWGKLLYEFCILPLMILGPEPLLCISWNTLAWAIQLCVYRYPALMLAALLEESNANVREGSVERREGCRNQKADWPFLHSWDSEADGMIAARESDWSHAHFSFAFLLETETRYFLNYSGSKASRIVGYSLSPATKTHNF